MSSSKLPSSSKECIWWRNVGAHVVVPPPTLNSRATQLPSGSVSQTQALPPQSWRQEQSATISQQPPTKSKGDELFDEEEEIIYSDDDDGIGSEEEDEEDVYYSSASDIEE